ncbi:hypothetical protein [Natrinema ejinorense]|uniref:Uncharacterized protein n=1 Tax=Natrinema ejinorense TaxID=373386 RepID=A0A2A5QS73_9EURY|nr:hypothetical protein [Natrinema ejinorense]PCR89654.1 hypothetical protein CP557_03345 [Natrinema ejinorense]
MIDSTLYVEDDAERKQPTMVKWAVDALSGDNQLTKGLKANEAILFDPEHDGVSDELTLVEEQTVRSMERSAGRPLRDLLEKIIIESEERGRRILRGTCSLENPNERVPRVSVYLIMDHMPDGRGLGDAIATSLARLVGSPWNSRSDRIHDLQRFREMIEDGLDAVAYEDSEFLRAVVEGESEHWDVSELHHLVHDREFWERDDLTVEMLREHPDRIPEGSKRPAALETALWNSERGWTDDEILDLIDELWSPKTPSTRKGYLEAISYEPEEVDLISMVDEKVGEVVSSVEDDDRFHEEKAYDELGTYCPPAEIESWKVAGLSGDPETMLRRVDRATVVTEEEAKQAISFLESKFESDPNWSLVEEAQEEFSKKMMQLRVNIRDEF